MMRGVRAGMPRCDCWQMSGTRALAGLTRRVWMGRCLALEKAVAEGERERSELERRVWEEAASSRDMTVQVERVIQKCKTLEGGGHVPVHMGRDERGHRAEGRGERGSELALARERYAEVPVAASSPKKKSVVVVAGGGSSTVTERLAKIHSSFAALRQRQGHGGG